MSMTDAEIQQVLGAWPIDNMEHGIAGDGTGTI